MDPIQELTTINFSYVFLSVFVILIGIKSVVSLFEWIVGKRGLETRWMRGKREEHELLLQTSHALASLQEKHEKDMLRSDRHDDEMKTDLKRLTNMFIDKQIDDMRWEINSFANTVLAGKRCNKDSYQHCIKTYQKYEKILQENGIKNGEVEISMELIHESYRQKLKDGF